MELDLRETSRYHDKVNELKKSFNYCMNNKSDLSYLQSKNGEI